MSTSQPQHCKARNAGGDSRDGGWEATGPGSRGQRAVKEDILGGQRRLAGAVGCRRDGVSGIRSRAVGEPAPRWEGEEAAGSGSEGRDAWAQEPLQLGQACQASIIPQEARPGIQPSLPVVVSEVQDKLRRGREGTLFTSVSWPPESPVGRFQDPRWGVASPRSPASRDTGV